MILKFSTFLFIGLLGLAPLYSVEYDGEKSYMIKTKYDICLIPPTANEAIAKGIKVIDIEKAKSLYDKKAYFYDARENRHYLTQRIKGADLVAYDASTGDYISAKLPIEKDESLVFYCYGESCANSYEAALAIRELGYTNIYWFINGFSKWKEKGYPMEGSSKE